MGIHLNVNLGTKCSSIYCNCILGLAKWFLGVWGNFWIAAMLTWPIPRTDAGIVNSENNFKDNSFDLCTALDFCGEGLHYDRAFNCIHHIQTPTSLGPPTVLRVFHFSPYLHKKFSLHCTISIDVCMMWMGGHRVNGKMSCHGQSSRYSFIWITSQLHRIEADHWHTKSYQLFCNQSPFRKFESTEVIALK